MTDYLNRDLVLLIIRDMKEYYQKRESEATHSGARERADWMIQGLEELENRIAKIKIRTTQPQKK